MLQIDNPYLAGYTDPRLLIKKKKRVHFIKSVQNTAFKLNFWFFKIKNSFFKYQIKTSYEVWCPVNVRLPPHFQLLLYMYSTWSNT